MLHYISPSNEMNTPSANPLDSLGADSHKKPVFMNIHNNLCRDYPVSVQLVIGKSLDFS